MSTQLSNGLLGRRRRINPLAPITLELTSISASVLSGNLTIPSTALPGDIAVFAQYAANTSGGAPASAEFAGATTVRNDAGGPNTLRRCMVSYKVLTAGDIGVPLSAMNALTAQKTVRIIRPSRAVSSITHGGGFGGWVTSAFLNDIGAPEGTPAFVFGRVLNAQAALTVQGSLTSNGDAMNEAINSNYRTWVEIQNGPSLFDRSLGSTNSTGVICGQAYYAYVT